MPTQMAIRDVNGWQVRRTRAVVRWYLDHHYLHPEDPGARQMFFDRSRVGRLAVSAADLGAGKPAALFKVLVACAMFQRRQDVQIMRILRELPARTAREVGSLSVLTSLADDDECPHLRNNAALITRCDLAKDPATKEGVCNVRPEAACHLKRHTVALRRYGHFGKVPTSIALTIREAGARDLRDLYRRTLDAAQTPAAASELMESTLRGAWRVNQKVACMFLSAVADPDLGGGDAPWSEGLDPSRFVVVDSNVDLYLTRIGYEGPWTYDARREFIQRLSARVDLAAMRPSLRRTNPRLVQQAIYLFMSATNRRALVHDCGHLGAAACAACPGELRAACPRRT